jgi:hypothetical protein
MMKKLLFTTLLALTAQCAFASAVVNASINGSSPNNIYQYMSASKTIVTLSSSTTMDNNNVKVFITNNTTGATLRNNSGVNINSFFSNPVQTLTYTELSSLLTPTAFTITGFSASELTNFNNNGILPDGNYTFCFEYWASMSVAPLTNQTDISSNNCPSGINISAAAQTVNVTTTVSFNMFNRNFSQLTSPGVLNTIITSNVNDYFGVTFAVIITGNNGLVIRSKNTKCSTAMRFNLGPSSSVTHMATGSEITDALDLNGLDVTGPAALVNNFNNKGFLADGNYTICFRGQTNCNNISDVNLGCASFTVAIDPIIITAPFIQTQTMEHKFDNLKSLQPSFMLMSKSDYPANIYIRLKVTGDNGVSFSSTPVFFIPAIQANVPLSLQVSDIAFFFISSNTTAITGMNASQFMADGMLPDGNYTFCYEIFDTDGITKISAPGTGCYQVRLFSDPVHVMTVAAPFTERDFDNISSKISAVTLTTQSNYSNVKVVLKMTGNNGVIITTNLSASPVSIPAITANVPVILNTTQIASLFNKGTLLTSGLPAQFNIDGKLPDGTYTVCFEVYNINNVVVSDPITSTCATPFTLSSRGTSLSLNEPPMIIMPHCGAAITKTDPQNMIFSWLMPSSLNMMKKLPNQDYILTVVEMNNPNANPYDAFRSATTPVFFRKNVTGNSYVYGPADPRLEVGKKYAFAVQVAKDFFDFRNNGQSDICWFTYGPDTSAKSMIKVDPRKKTDKITSKACVISAQVMFTHGHYKEAGKAAKIENYADHAQDENTAYPARNQSVRLVSAVSALPVYKVKIRVPEIKGKDTSWKWVMVDSMASLTSNSDIKPIVDEMKAKLSSVAAKSLNKTVATGFTDEFGNVTFNVPATNPYPVIIDTLLPAGFTQQMDTMKMLADAFGFEWPFGAVDHWVIARGYVLDLANPLYTDPTVFFTPVNTQVLSAGKITTSISSYRLNVTIKDQLILESGSSNFFKNVVTKGPVTVYVLKKKKAVNNYPEYEGNPLKRGELTLVKGISGDVVDQTYTIMDKMEIPYNESAHFLRQYYSVYTTDKYYIYATYDKGNTFYEAKPFSKPVSRAWNTYDPDEQNIYGSQNMTLSPDLVDGVVKGSLTYSFYDFAAKTRLGAKQMPKGVSIKLVQMTVNYDGKKNTYSNIKEIDVTTTDQNGDFTFKTGKLQYNDYLALTGSGTFTTKLYVMVGNAYYHSPTTPIYIKPQSTITNLGTLECYVRQGEYGSKIVTRKPDASSDYLAESNWLPRVGDKVFLCRRKGVVIAGLPEDEGSLTKSSLSKQTMKDLDGNEYTVIDETTTGDKGRYKFSRIVFRDKNNTSDKLFIFSEVPFGSYDNYKTPKPYDLNLEQENGSQLKLNVDYKPQTYGMCYNSPNGWCGEESFPQDPYIVGAVYPITNPTETMEGVKVEMFNMGSMKLEDGKKFVADNKAVAQSVQYTADNGRFEFREINKGMATGWKILRFTKKGFIPKIVVINNGAPLKKGQRESLDKVYLELPIITYCYTKDENGNGVSGKIIVGDNFSWAPTSLVFAPEYGEAAKLECPSGDVQFIFIPNNTDEYAIDTFTKKISSLTKFFNYTIKKARHRITISLLDKSTSKAISFKAVITNMPAQAEAQSYKFFNAQVVYFEFASAATKFDIKIIPDETHEILNITVNSKPGKTVQFIELKSGAARVITGTVSYKTTTQFNGKKINIDKAIEGASVYIKGFENTIGVALTETNGSYSLGHVPVQTYYTLTATKEDGWIGQTKNINSSLTEYKFKSGKLTGQNFTLTKFTEFDISHLYGFPLLVEKLIDQGESVIISGKIKLNPGDDGKPKKAYQPIKEIDMTGDDPMLASISNAVLKKSNYKQDISDLSKTFQPYTLNINVLPYILYSTYAGSLENKDGLKLVHTNSSGTSGAVKGYASIDPASFSKGFSYTGDIYLNTPETSIKEKTASYKNSAPKTVEYQPNNNYAGSTLSDMAKQQLYGNKKSTSGKTSELPLFTSSGKIPTEFTSGFKVSDDDGNTLIYTLHLYEQVETKKSSYFDKNGLHLESVLHTDLLHVEETPDIKLALGTVNINVDYAQTVTSKNQFKIMLGKWGIVAEEWTMGQGGLKISKGRLEASALTVPFSSMLVGQQEMSFAKFEFSSVKLLNNDKLKLNINQANTITGFGFDKGYGGEGSKGAWSLSIIAKSGGYLSAITGLPDLEPADKIMISNINLYNTGDDKILLKENHPPVTIAGVTQFYPTAIWGTSAEIKFKGNISLDIPNLTGLSNVSYDLTFKMDKNKQLYHAPSETKLKGLQLKAKGIEVAFSINNQSLANKEARFYGTLTDADKQSTYSFQVILTKAAGPNGECKMVLNKEKGVTNTFPLDKEGKAKLDNLNGMMIVTGKEWGNFTFDGDIKGVKGVDEPENKDKHLKFVIKGDLVAENSKIGANNMNGPSGSGLSGLALTYDFEKNGIVGSGHMDQNAPNGRFVGDIELFMGGEWYFFASIKVMNLKNCPINEFGAAMFVGNGVINPGMKTAMAGHFHENKLPAYIIGLQKHTGVLFAGGFDIPIPEVPTWDLNIGGLVKSSFHNGIYAGCYFSLTFVSDAELAIGGRVGAWVELGAGATIGIACFNINLKADASVGLEGSIKKSGAFSIKVDITLTLSGSAYVGGGVCNSDCKTPCWETFLGDVCSPIPCVKTGMSGSETITLTGYLTNSGFELSFK